MAGFDNDNVWFSGIDTRGVKPIVNQMTTDGQILIASTAAPNIRVGTIAAGAGIIVTPGAGTITIAATGAGFTWSTVTSATNPNALAVQNAYIAGGGVQVNFVLPAVAAVGDSFIVTGYLTLFQIQQNAAQIILFAGQATTVGVAGSLTSTSTTDHLQITCIVANTVFKVTNAIGNITVV